MTKSNGVKTKRLEALLIEQDKSIKNVIGFDSKEVEFPEHIVESHCWYLDQLSNHDEIIDFLLRVISKTTAPKMRRLLEKLLFIFRTNTTKELDDHFHKYEVYFEEEIYYLNDHHILIFEMMPYIR